LSAISPGRVHGRQLRVVYIAGAKNCGSTLLDAVLGNASGTFSLGEVAGFHRYEPGAACACGEPSEHCRVCRAVHGAIGETVPSADVRRLSTLPLRERRFYWALVGSRTRRAYAQLAEAIFDAAAAATESSVLIDSSKNVARAAALVHDGRHDVRIVHLVRDGRGYMRSRRKRAEVGATRYVPPFAFAGWLAKNVLISSVLARRVPRERYLLCRYEDLIRDPANELERIGRFAGLDTTGLAALAVDGGVCRRHLFEPPRRTDYRHVRLDAKRLETQRWSPRTNAGYWVLGGFLSKRWGYDREQSYLDDRVMSG
jgi:hypothetical protein